MANERLREALLRKGFDLEHAAAATGVDRKTVERWITQGRVPYPRHRRTIAALVREAEDYLWPDAVPPELAESEVVKVYPRRSDIPTDLWDRLLGTATRRVDALSLAALFLVERPDFARQLRRKAEEGTKVRLLFGDPGAREAAKRSEEEQLGKGTVAARIRNALAFVRPLAGVEGIEIRLHRRTLYNSVFRFDDEMVVNTHVYGVPGGHAPAMHLRKLSSSSMFDTYSTSFATVWAGAEEARL
ncbi:DUF5919 domain-containing protein [Allokutzneria sp. A3M-2-11 16]|uniref:DUF5919 domain-containing protein n=1 Tax=Allokutzneria sp. A3M-2-11 16 TaxID=2962043 RepID=UPI0020B8E302|nr:DUF5919 domain-containing protein [Allokutzneria sp. A3M-2-11 16]MCP3804415.1 DUF5919 domain-containing protein [Allokutzneria sp. A3M-2-11 16]